MGIPIITGSIIVEAKRPTGWHPAPPPAPCAECGRCTDIAVRFARGPEYATHTDQLTWTTDERCLDHPPTTPAARTVAAPTTRCEVCDGRGPLTTFADVRLHADCVPTSWRTDSEKRDSFMSAVHSQAHTWRERR